MVIVSYFWSKHKHETHTLLRLCLIKFLSGRILRRGKNLVDYQGREQQRWGPVLLLYQSHKLHSALSEIVPLVWIQGCPSFQKKYIVCTDWDFNFLKLYLHFACLVTHWCLCWPSPAMKSNGICSTFDIITFDQNWHHYSQVLQEEKIFPIILRSEWLGHLTPKYAWKCSEIWVKNSEENFLQLHLTLWQE